MANRQIKPLPLTLTAEVAATFYANNKGNTTANKISTTTKTFANATYKHLIEIYWMVKTINKGTK